MLPPISTEGITSSHDDIQALTDKTRNAMLDAIEDLGRKRQAILRAQGVPANAIRANDERQPLLTATGTGEGETASATVDPEAE